jgi:hypothetical protein
VLIGGLLLLYAWAFAAVSTSSESATYCPSVLGRDLVARSGDQAFCTPIVDERNRLVLIVGVVGLLLVVAGVARGRSQLFGRSPLADRVSIVTRISLVVLGLLTLILTYSLLIGALILTGSTNREMEDLVRATLSICLAAAALVVAALARSIGRRGHRLTLDHSMVAVSLGAPLMALILVDVDAEGVTDPGLIDPTWTSSVLPLVVCGVPVALALLVSAGRQNRQLLSPPAGVSGLALLAAAAAFLVAMVPDAFSSGYGLDSDQSINRFVFWVLVAVGLPWVTFAAWKLSDGARTASPDDVHKTLA